MGSRSRPSCPSCPSFFRIVLFLALVASLSAQELIVSPHTNAPPAELEDPIEALMASGGQQVALAGKTLQFSWVKSLPLRSGSTDATWSEIDEGMLVGAVRLSADFPDIRGSMMKAGVYTLRYGIEPADGNHIGVSPYREFLLLSPAAVDKSVGALGHDGTIAISRQSIGLSHPACWSLDPPVTSDAPASVHTDQSGFVHVVFEVPVSRDGKDAGTLKFGLILKGQIQS
jgi:hypothetical protein